MYARDSNKEEKVASGRETGSANGARGGRGKGGSSPSSNFPPLFDKLRTAGRGRNRAGGGDINEA